jgi:hypothetical protein
MKAVSPVVPGKELKEIIIAENQDQYENLPAVICEGGVVLTRWELSEEEKKFVAEHGYIHLWIWTFGKPLQPLLLTVDPPDFDENAGKEMLVDKCVENLEEDCEKPSTHPDNF